MANFLQQVHSKVPLAVVGGSDMPKVIEQLGGTLEKAQSTFDYLFFENGLVGFHGTKSLPEEVIGTRLLRF